MAIADGKVRSVAVPHNLWLIANQDCDLAWRALTNQEPSMLVELRPVFTVDPPSDWGIRSQRFRIDAETLHLRADEPSVRVTPEVVAAAEHDGCLDEDSQQRLKTWLGYRYDRPAVPQTFVDLARAVAEQLMKKSHRRSAAPVRDVLAQFWEEDDGTTGYQLTAVLPGGPYEDGDQIIATTRSWMARAVMEVDVELGSAKSIEVYGDEEVPLAFVEKSFSLDLSRLSWPSNAPGPSGAV